jgi:carboxyl-terminal processing protease
MEITLKNLMAARGIRIVASLLAILSLPVHGANETAISDSELVPQPRHEKIGQLVTEFIQKSHYQHAAVDDELSSKVLDRYIEALDNNRMYFLASDIAAFEQFRFKLDDMVRSEPLDPVFQMFEVYRTRVRDRFFSGRSIRIRPPKTALGEK